MESNLREEWIREVAAKGYTVEVEPVYSGEIKPGMRFTLGKGRLGQVSSVRAVYRYLSAYPAPAIIRYNGSFEVHYQSINPKTDKPWQSLKNTTPERVLAALVAK